MCMAFIDAYRILKVIPILIQQKSSPLWRFPLIAQFVVKLWALLSLQPHFGFDSRRTLVEIISIKFLTNQPLHHSLPLKVHRRSPWKPSARTFFH